MPSVEGQSCPLLLLFFQHKIRSILLRGRKKAINLIESDDEKEQQATTSSGWLEKTSHQTLKKKELTKPKPRSSGPNKKRSKIVNDSDESEDLTFDDDGEEEDEAEAEAELDDPKDRRNRSPMFKDMAPTVIYQLHEDNISKLLKDREQGQKKFQTQQVEKRGTGGGCSLSHTSTKTTQPNKGSSGRLLKKRIRSLSLTDSDVESIDASKAPPLSPSPPPQRDTKKREVIVLGSDEEDDDGPSSSPVSSSISSAVSQKNKRPAQAQGKAIKVIEALDDSDEAAEGSADDNEGSFQSEGSDGSDEDDDDNDAEKGNDTDDEGSGGGGKWYGSESESEQSDHGSKRKRRGSDDEKDEEDLRQDMERKCRRVLQRCGDVSKLLRQALLSWNSCQDNDSAVGSCVSLISLSAVTTGDPGATAAQNIITQDLITQKISAQLILKDYQLVGLNWMKLMHTNDVNGVLADDMGLG
jgi:hypothetical protein